AQLLHGTEQLAAKANSIDQASGTIARSAHGAGDCFRALSPDEQSVAAQMKKKHIVIVSLVAVLVLGGLVWIAQRFEVGKEEKKAAEAARKELKQTQERFNLKLATNQELSAAEKTARDAEAQLTALQRAGAGGDNRIHSDISGVIAKVDAQDGQIVPAGGPLVEIVAENE